jgi:integrase
MIKLKLPKNPYKGIKIYCHKCKRDNPTNCNHYDVQKYKVRIHIAGTANKKVTKVLKSKVYAEAVKEAIIFEDEIKANNFKKVVATPNGNNYSIMNAVIRYNQYLSGNYEYSQFVKEVSDAHRKECIRFCRFFCNVMKDSMDITKTRIADVNKKDVAKFYTWVDYHYKSGKTFNKCLNALKMFFKFLIDIEDVKMKNPFEGYTSRSEPRKKIVTLNKNEFEAIINAVDTFDSKIKLGGRGEVKNMYRPYLKDAFKLFLFTGCRREEVVRLKWSDIYTSANGVEFFQIENIKVVRQTDNDYLKYIPINADLNDLLINLGYHQKKGLNDFILEPIRKESITTIMNTLSKAFTHYKKQTRITKDISLKNLRKTYISWVYAVMHKDTGALTSHSTHEILEKHYIDPTILGKIEVAALGVKIFG